MNRSVLGAAAFAPTYPTRTVNHGAWATPGRLRIARRISLAAAVSALALASAPAHASLIFDSSIHLDAQGFGNAPRLLTIQNTGTESGCVGVDGGGIVVGSAGCISAATPVHDSNGVTNLGGNEPPPQTDNQKYGIPTVGVLGWQSGADVGLLFNPNQTGFAPINVADITLKFYDGTVLVGAIDGQQYFASTDPGVGVAGFVFVVDAAEQDWLNNNIFNQQGFGGFRIALESTLGGDVGPSNDGPDSWLAFNRSNPTPTPQGFTPEPATWATMLIGFGFVGAAMRRRNRHQAVRFSYV